MTVWPHENELSFIERSNLRLLYSDRPQRNPARTGCIFKERHIRPFAAEIEQDKALAKEVQRRFPVVHPCVRRSAARPGCLLIVGCTKRGRRGSVREANGRILVAITELNSEAIPLLMASLAQLLANPLPL